jgi:hypothetical protein
VTRYDDDYDNDNNDDGDNNNNNIPSPISDGNRRKSGHILKLLTHSQWYRT